MVTSPPGGGGHINEGGNSIVSLEGNPIAVSKERRGRVN